MVSSNHKFIYFLVLIGIISLIIKFFTAIVVLKDDPTNFLVFQTIPSFKNELFLNSINENHHMIIMSDENGIIGEDIYYFITHYFWWIIVMFTLFTYYLSRKHH